ncbi:Serine/threonine-protein kinase-transforming protein Rmil [Echria macrotheca]|uniref:Serine/threonine-protein kinase-transforming protein Rmil n=1 Tax=Echria macrotheca TaxID=438768 RepID=A0AAJ0B655_9PEZI|nr:Serine/threonine-protein kinase-transforming protein Rmil [Echria macrotheca]
MASVELVLAAVGAADLCLKYGKRLIQAYRALKNANETIEEKVTVVEAIWSRTAIQVEFVKRIANTLEPDHCRIHARVLGILLAKLSAAVAKIESVVDPDTSEVKKFKFLFNKSDIEEVIVELEQWQRLFDPTWYLILRMGDQTVDAELSRPLSDFSGSTLVSPNASSSSLNLRPERSFTPVQRLRSTILEKPQAGIHISLSESGLDWENATSIPYSTTRVIPRNGGEKKRRSYLVDIISCTPDLDVERTRADATALAKKLAQVDPSSFGLLCCNGLVKRKDAEKKLSSLSLVFHMPEKTGQHPTTLRDHLLHSTGLSLTRILNVVRQLAGAVSFVHTCDFVHKNIRPETIIVFPDMDDTGSSLGSAYLMGFDSFRSVNFHTLRAGDAAWDRNLYRHPSRQGIFAQDKYCMQHDVYALGVCLLELGLWESFVGYRDGKAVLSDALGLTLDDFGFLDGKSQADMLSSGNSIKDHLVTVARERLPRRMGDKYTAVVITCLTCLDKDNEDFGNEDDMKDDDGILIGVRFIEKVLLKLGDISF